MKSYLQKSMVILAVVGLFSCKKDKTPDPIPAPIVTNVYACGYSSGNPGQSLYWKNGVETVLNATGNYSTTEDIFVNGTDVYIAGRESVGSGTMKPKYWKNGISFPLVVGANVGGNALRVIYNNSEVYAVGYENTNPTTPKLWQNGVSISLATNPIGNFKATGFSYVNGNLYVSGTETFGSSSRALYWLNGVPVYLTALIANNTNAAANDIFVSGTDVYVCGKGIAGFPTIWKNGTEIIYQGNGILRGVLHSIKVVGTDVYTAGAESPSAIGETAKYWKNGVPVTMDGLIVTSTAYSLFVLGANVYCGGSNQVGIDNKPLIWKNGITTTPTLSPQSTIAVVRGIFVTN